MPHIKGDHPRDAALAQHLRESARRGPDIQRRAAGNRDRESVQRRDQLVAARLT